MNGATGGEPYARLRDNPILLAQARRRLRPRAALPLLGIAALLALCGLLAAATQEGLDEEAWTFLTQGYLLMIGLALLLFGSPLVGNTLVDERADGILDFHRATPLRPMTLALGYLLGCPAREYACAAAILPFLGLSLLWAQLSPAAVIGALAVLLVSAWFFHSFSMLAGLSMDFSRRQSGAATFLLLMILLGSAADGHEPYGFTFYLTPIPALVHLLLLQVGNEHQWKDLSAPFFAWRVDPVLYSLLLQSVLTGFLLTGCARRLQSETTPIFSRPGALGLFVTLITVGLGHQWPQLDGDDALPLQAWFSVGMAFLAAVLLVVLAPTYLTTVRSLHRVRRLGLAEVPWLEDGATGWPLVAAFSLLAAVGSAGLLAGTSGSAAVHVLASRPFFMLVLAQTVWFAFVAGAVEYVRMSMRNAWRNGALFIAFCALLLPWILMGVASAIAEKGSNWFAILSPLSGLIAAWSELGQAQGVAAAGLPRNLADIGTGILLLPSALASAWLAVRCHRIRRALAEALPGSN